MDIDSKFETVSKNLDAINEGVNSLMAEKDKLNQLIERLRVEQTSLTDNLNNLTKQLDAEKQTGATTREGQSSLQTEHEKLVAEKAVVDAELATCKVNLDKVNKNLDDLITKSGAIVSLISPSPPSSVPIIDGYFNNGGRKRRTPTKKHHNKRRPKAGGYTYAKSGKLPRKSHKKKRRSIDR